MAVVGNFTVLPASHGGSESVPLLQKGTVSACSCLQEAETALGVAGR